MKRRSAITFISLPVASVLQLRSFVLVRSDSQHWSTESNNQFATTRAFLLVLLLLSRGALAEDRANPSLLKVMSYNIHYGQGTDHKVDLARIARIISEQNPDIVGLQEIGNRQMAEELGRLTSLKAAFGQSLGNDTGYGDATLSKHPFKWVANQSIPSASSSRYQAMAIDVDVTKVTGQSTTVRFINTHFDWLKTIGSEQARLASVDVIEKAFFRGPSFPAILTGDLNSIPTSDTLSKLVNNGWVAETLGRNLDTMTSEKSSRQIDYVLLRPKQRWRVVEVTVLAEPLASDHLPVMMTVQLR